MKRINPTTNQPFKRGDVREDGYLFEGYRTTRPLKKDGTFQENWHCPSVFERQTIYKNKNSIKWKANNIERVRQHSKKHAKENPEQYAAKAAKRRASKLQRTPKWLTEDDLWIIEQAYEIAQLRTKMTGFEWHVDHIIPLQGKLVSGLHVPNNLQVIPGKENVKKSNKHTI